ncbi:MAG: hypothetical protein QNI91_03410 [Arenicellales bacterium]|nr:hypothetical protein [Arenicellales bacterium]
MSLLDQEVALIITRYKEVEAYRTKDASEIREPAREQSYSLLAVLRHLAPIVE